MYDDNGNIIRGVNEGGFINGQYFYVGFWGYDSGKPPMSGGHIGCTKGFIRFKLL